MFAPVIPIPSVELAIVSSEAQAVQKVAPDVDAPFLRDAIAFKADARHLTRERLLQAGALAGINALVFLNEPGPRLVDLLLVCREWIAVGWSATSSR